jgi:uncharacterized protein YfaS (alpha-2-macroglobulin family)
MEREGTGTLYYTAVLRYGIPAELAAARDEGLGVYVETLDDSDKPVSPDALIAGQTYTRRVVLSSSRERFFVALRSPIPSGAEVLDAALVTSSRLHPPEEEDGPGDDGPGPDGVDREAFPGEPVRFILDDEIRFHWDRFPPGRQEVRYRFRAFMPGVYPTPPTSAECMYEPEVFGRTAGELARISLPGL